MKKTEKFKEIIAINFLDMKINFKRDIKDENQQQQIPGNLVVQKIKTKNKEKE